MLRKAKVKTEQEVEGRKVRVWWPPTRDRKRTEFAGAYWPANLLNKTPGVYEVSYDNGEKEKCKAEFVFETDHPCKFGTERVAFSAGEFVEVSNGSKSDPCAWLARIRSVAKDGKIMVEYPFHDTPAEQVKPSLVRRARLPQGDDWLVLAPYQAWEDGQVLSPLDLELIPESALAARLKAPPAALATSSEDDSQERPTRRNRKVHADAQPAEETSSKRKRQRKTKPAPADEAAQEASPAPTLAAAAAPAEKKRRQKAAAVAAEEAVEGSGEAAAGPSRGRASRVKAAEPRGSRARVAKPMSAADFFAERNTLPIILQNPAAAEDMELALSEAWRLADPGERAVCELAEHMARLRHVEASGKAPTTAGRPSSSSKPSDPGAVKGRSADVLFAIDFRRTLDYSKFDIKTGVRLTDEAWKALDEGIKNKYNESAKVEQARCDRENAIRSDKIRKSRDAGLTFDQQQQAAASAIGADRPSMHPLAGQPTAIPLPTAVQMLSAGVGSLPGGAPFWPSNPMAAMALMRAAATVRSPMSQQLMMGPALAALQQQQLSALAAAMAPSPLQAASPVPPHAATSFAPHSAAEVQAVLYGGMEDIKAARGGLAACGYGPGAYRLLLDAWREDSPRLHDALRAYSTHVRGCAVPDWDAFMIHMYGLERMAGLRADPRQELLLQQQQRLPAQQQRSQSEQQQQQTNSQVAAQAPTEQSAQPTPAAAAAVQEA